MEIKNAAWGKSMYVCIVLFLKLAFATIYDSVIHFVMIMASQLNLLLRHNFNISRLSNFSSVLDSSSLNFPGTRYLV